MAQMWRPQPIEVLKSWVDAIHDEAADSLNEWEMEFIESVSSILASGRQLSQRQEQVLERIYAEKTS
jgi:hypothetical protein